MEFYPSSRKLIRRGSVEEARNLVVGRQIGTFLLSVVGVVWSQ